MIRFTFQARARGSADDGVLMIEISPPRPVADFPYDFECPIRFSGVINREMRGVGAFPLQAVDLALQVCKAVATSYQHEWDFSVEGQGPVTFDY